MVHYGKCVSSGFEAWSKQVRTSRTDFKNDFESNPPEFPFIVETLYLIVGVPLVVLVCH